jgi:hypothetical protein
MPTLSRPSRPVVHRLVLAVSLAAGGLVACGPEVRIDAHGSGGSGGDTGQGGGNQGGATTTTGTTSSTGGAGGAGGSGGLGPQDCTGNEGLLVAAASYTGGVLFAAQTDGAWSEVQHLPVQAPRMATFTDVYGAFGVFWIAGADDQHKSHFVRTKKGPDIESHDVTGWLPDAAWPLLGAGSSLLVGHTGTDANTVGGFDPDAFDWLPWYDLGGFAPASVAAGGIGDLVAVRVNQQDELCEIEVTGGLVGPAHCHPEMPVEVVVGGEIQLAPPQVVALPNGDAVVVYFKPESGAALAAATLSGGVWSAPVTTSAAYYSVDLAATATPSGDVIVALSQEGGTQALRFSPKTGWGDLIAVDPMVYGSSFTAAPGICGDDAAIAYVVTGFKEDREVRVARVRGNQAAATVVMSGLVETPNIVSLTTRPVF